tara:strand:- start:111 stop:491 length:381 start_codon:yes stop_codon:yes gene_type:complete
MFDCPVTKRRYLRRFLMRASMMFVFGLVDNMLMISSGAWIDDTIAVRLGASTMFAAALGNMFSNVCALMVGQPAEKWFSKIGLKYPQLADEEMRQFPRWARFLDIVAPVIGLVLGCLCGMVILFWL